MMSRTIGQHELQLLSRVLLVLPPPAPADVVTGREPHLAGDRLPRLATKPPTSRPCTLRRTVASSSPFSDEIIAGPRACSIVRARRGESARPGRSTRTAPSAAGRPDTRAHTAPAREARAPFDSHREHGLAHRGFDDLLDRADADAVPGGRVAIDVDVQVLAARDLLRIDIAGPWDAAKDFRDAARRLLEHGEIGAEHLHSHFRTDAGGKHVDAVDDRHRPDVETPGSWTTRLISARRRSSVMPGRHLSRRLEVDDGLGHVERRWVCGRLRARDLRDWVLNLRELHEGGVLPRGDPRVLLERDARVGDRHEDQVAFVERRHELAADPARQHERTDEKGRRDRQRERAVSEPASSAGW